MAKAATGGSQGTTVSCLFCRVVSGQEAAWAVWEDGRHLALLSPFPTMRGETVVIPKEHLSDNVFLLDRVSYQGLMYAVKEVAGLLMEALNVSRCALVFEGTGVQHVHAKLYPLEGRLAGARRVWPDFSVHFRTYQGWLCTAPGPRWADDDLKALADLIRARAGRNASESPRSSRRRRRGPSGGPGRAVS